MAKKWIFAVFCSLIMSAVSCNSPPAAKLSPLNSSSTIVSFGDSLTVGFGAEANESYPAVLAKLLGRKVVNAGVNGETTEAALARLDSVIHLHRPTLLIICIGTNDFYMGLDRDQAKINLEKMIKKARSSKAEVVLIATATPAPFPSTHVMFAELSKKYSLPLLKSKLPELLANPDMRTDELHLNARGYEQLAISLHELLITSGAIKR